MLEALCGGLQMFFELQKQRNNVWGFDLLWVFNYSLTSLSTLAKFDYKTKRKVQNFEAHFDNRDQDQEISNPFASPLGR
jgi:hypothetical protein